MESWKTEWRGPWFPLFLPYTITAFDPVVWASPAASALGPVVSAAAATAPATLNFLCVAASIVLSPFDADLHSSVEQFTS